MKYASPPPNARLDVVGEDLRYARAGWQLSYHTQGKGWYDIETGLFDAELTIDRLVVPVLDLYRAPVRRNGVKPDPARLAKHRRQVESVDGMMGDLAGLGDMINDPDFHAWMMAGGFADEL